MAEPRICPDELRTTTRAFDDVHAPLFTVGQVAEMLGVQPAFLRRLDAEAVVQPARSDGGQRRYTRLEIELVEKVVVLSEQGVTLAGIRHVLALEDRVKDLERQLNDRDGEQPDDATAPSSTRRPQPDSGKE